MTTDPKVLASEVILGEGPATEIRLLEAPARVQGNDDLCTPAWLLAELEGRLGPIALDPCSNPWSLVDAAHTFDGSSLERCGLTNPWFPLLDVWGAWGWAFVNPPYGRGHPRAWADKIVHEAGLGCEIVALVKGDFSTVAFQRLRAAARAVAYFTERISFEGGAHGSGQFASVAFYFGARRFAFASALEDFADIRIL